MSAAAAAKARAHANAAVLMRPAVCAGAEKRQVAPARPTVSPRLGLGGVKDGIGEIGPRIDGAPQARRAQCDGAYLHRLRALKAQPETGKIFEGAGEGRAVPRAVAHKGALCGKGGAVGAAHLGGQGSGGGDAVFDL